jgi:hypothetical protein
MAGTAESLAPGAPECCSGTMCPMHQPTNKNPMNNKGSQGAGCDMDMSHTGFVLQSCPKYALHYAPSLVFVCAVPLTHFGEPAVERAPVFAAGTAPYATPGIDSPPPRTSAS